jgi:hypothetical protein
MNCEELGTIDASHGAFRFQFLAQDKGRQRTDSREWITITESCSACWNLRNGSA